MAGTNSFVNPVGLAKPNGFSHVVTSTRRTTVFVAGQVAYDRDGRIVGAGELAAQTHQVYTNLEQALAAAGATMRDVVKTVLFVRDLDPAKAGIIRAARAPFLSPDAPPASTMVGVASLAHPDLLLEVEATAMLEE